MVALNSNQVSSRTIVFGYSLTFVRPFAHMLTFSLTGVSENVWKFVNLTYSTILSSSLTLCGIKCFHKNKFYGHILLGELLHFLSTAINLMQTFAIYWCCCFWAFHRLKMNKFIKKQLLEFGRLNFPSQWFVVNRITTMQ